MAKKVRRAKKKRKTTETAVAPATNTQIDSEVSAVAATSKPKTKTQKRAAKKQATVEDFRQEYAYVGQDLRRVLILSAAMFALLIVLNLILQF